MYKFLFQSKQAEMSKIAEQQRYSSSSIEKDGNLTSSSTLVKIYLRRSNKSSVVVQLNEKITGQQLFQLARTKMSIEANNLVLFYKGFKLDRTSYLLHKQYKLNPGDIIHIHNKQQVFKQTICVSLKLLQPSVIQTPETFIFSSMQKIKDAFSNILQLDQKIILYESSRRLCFDKTFAEQLIEDGTTIIVTSFVPNYEVKWIDRKMKIEVEQDMDNRTNQSLPTLNLGHARDCLKKGFSMTERLDKKKELTTFSFKKKKNCSVYKSSNISQGVIESQPSNSAELTKLLKQIAIKRNKQMKNLQEKDKQDEQQENYRFDKDDDQKIYIIEPKPSLSSDEQENQQEQERNPKFSVSERISLQKQFKKLLFSDGNERSNKTQGPPSVPKLLPPQIFNDDFFQESEQIQIDDEQQQNQQQQEQMKNIQDDDQIHNNQVEEANEEKNDFRKTFDLRQSIGKSRGVFVAPMIPTRDFQIEDNDSDSYSDED